MPDPQRVEFITRHFKDLQSIRYAPVPALMLFAPFAANGVPHVSPLVAAGILLSFLFCGAGFGWWSTVAIKRRYGSVKPSTLEAQRMQGHPAIVVITVITLAAISWFFIFGPSKYCTYAYCASMLLTAMLRTILDSTNPASRRVVWAIGLVVLFGVGPFLIGVDGGAAVFLLGGVVWLSISVFDFLLLRRTFEEISSSPSSGATDVAAQYG